MRGAVSIALAYNQVIYNISNSFISLVPYYCLETKAFYMFLVYEYLLTEYKLLLFSKKKKILYDMLNVCTSVSLFMSAAHLLLFYILVVEQYSLSSYDYFILKKYIIIIIKIR